MKKAEHSSAPQKSASAFRTISEVADELGVEQHVLRFWETKFNQIKPLKRGGGRRYYRPEDVVLLKNIHTLLYSEGYTIRGVQKLLSATRGRLSSYMEGSDPAPKVSGKKKAELASMLAELKSMRRLIDQE
jgi:DNA-binding transcriptional MerR regulator